MDSKPVADSLEYMLILGIDTLNQLYYRYQEYDMKSFNL